MTIKLLALFDTDAVLTTACVRCGQDATTRVHARPDLQARNTWPYEVTGPGVVTSPRLHAGADSAPMCDACGHSMVLAWRSRHHSPCGATYDLWHVWTTPIGPKRAAA